MILFSTVKSEISDISINGNVLSRNLHNKNLKISYPNKAKVEDRFLPL